MKTAWFDCISGISGDMTLGALLDAGTPIDVLRLAIQAVLPELNLDARPVTRHGFRATQAIVVLPHEHEHHHAHEHEHHHHVHQHRSMADIRQMILASSLETKIQQEAIGVFELIAQAEGKVHGCAADEVHFHEVGAADSIADIIGAAAGLNYLGVDAVCASPVPTGCGSLEIAHGRVSIPAPATAELLKGVPLAPSSVPFELTTPTGAGILKFYAKRFEFPAMKSIESIGVGAGSRDLPQQANILRLVIGQAEEQVSSICSHSAIDSAQDEAVWQLETNLDNMSGELIGFALEQIGNLKPLDVWTTAISMKKQRPGVTISVLCRESQINKIETALFTHTATLGIRKWRVERRVLPREECTIVIPAEKLGSVSSENIIVKGKRAILPNGTVRLSPEYDDVSRISRQTGVSLLELYKIINSSIN